MIDRERSLRERTVSEAPTSGPTAPDDSALEQVRRRSQNGLDVIDRALSVDSREYLGAVRQRGGQ